MLRCVVSPSIGFIIAPPVDGVSFYSECAKSSASGLCGRTQYDQAQHRYLAAVFSAGLYLLPQSAFRSARSLANTWAQAATSLSASASVLTLWQEALGAPLRFSRLAGGIGWSRCLPRRLFAPAAAALKLDHEQPLIGKHIMRMGRMLSLSLLVFFAGVITSVTSASAQQKPNIIMIMGDDIGMWNIGAYHHGLMAGRTPNIDQLAAEGMLFTDYYAEASCTAGRILSPANCRFAPA